MKSGLEGPGDKLEVARAHVSDDPLSRGADISVLLTPPKVDPNDADAMLFDVNVGIRANLSFINLIQTCLAKTILSFRPG